MRTVHALAKEMIVAVFSHNRGQHLEVALASWRKYASLLSVMVFDDGSTDPLTIECLRAAEQWAEVYYIVEERSGERGGLHANMQRALDIAAQRGYRYILFSQDDVQVVRHLEDEDAAQIVESFDCVPNVIQVSPRFVGEKRFLANGSRFVVDPRNGMLDVGIVRVDRLKQINWTFSNSEMVNSFAAYDKGLRRVVMPDPFLAHAPWPNTVRNGVRGLAVRVCDKIVGAGVHRFLPMSEAEIARLRNRSRVELASAEEWLRIEGKVLRPWGYGSSVEELRRRIRYRLASLLRGSREGATKRKTKNGG